MIIQKTCFKVVCETTNSSHDTVSREDDKHPYLECNDRELYVMAKTLSEVEAIVGPNAKIIAKLGPCYEEKGEG